MSSTSPAAAAQSWYVLSAIFTGFFGFAICVAFFVGAFFVRRTRPDAFALFLTASLIQTANLFISHGLSMALPALVLDHGSSSMTGAEDYARGMFFVHVFTTFMFTLGNGVLLAGILKLAKPPAFGNAFAEGRYE